MSQGYGWKAKIGQLYPSGGQCDFEPQIMAPPGVQFVTTRLPFRRSHKEDDINLVRDLESHAVLCADAQVDLMLLNCTAASLLVGPETINRRVFEATGVPSYTTIEAVLAALDAAGLRRVALLTPYVDEVVQAEIEFFDRIGIEVVRSGGIPCDNPVDQGSIPPERWRQLAAELLTADAQGLLISCAGIQVSGVLQHIEDLWQRPVIASNQAAVWHALRLLKLPDRLAGHGGLLAGLYDTP